MTLSMGNLKETRLEDILVSEARDRIRKGLVHIPDECSGCSLMTTCRGGCRGRSFLLNDSFDKKDPACHLNR